MIGFLKPAAHRSPLPDDKVDATYRRLRLQVFLGIFVGYAGYYLVRKNFSLAMPYLVEQGYSKTDLGLALSGVAIAYGLSKFIMGSVSDRSNARVFMSLGLCCSALVMIVDGHGTDRHELGDDHVRAAADRTAGFRAWGGRRPGGSWCTGSRRNERGTKMAIWNVAHNIGGGMVGPIAILAMAIFADWHAILYVHGFFAIAIAAFIFLTVRDAPQSEGLPNIEKYRDDYPRDFAYSETHEQEFSAKAIFLEYVLNNKLLWTIALANAFVYFVRYGVLDWAPTYLSEAKQFSFADSGWAYALYEFAGIPGTLVCGWLSDKVFKGRRAPASILFSCC